MRARRQHRRGMNLMEVMIAISILVVMVVIVSMGAWWSLGARYAAAARQTAMTLQFLHDEAVLQNMTFRMAWHVDENYWQVEVGDAATLIFDTPEARERYQEEIEDKMELLPHKSDDSGAADETEFAALQDRFHKKFQLPSGMRFGGVYTPQFEDMVTPTPESERGEDDPPKVVYSYILADGFAEHTVVWLVYENDPESGWTIEIEPLTGEVRFTPDLVSVEDTRRDIPTTGPELPI